MSRHTTRTGRRIARFLVGVTALTGVLALVAVAPLVLLIAWRYLGAPVPSLHELLRPDDGTVFVRVLCLIGWASWITFTWAVLAELLAQWRGVRLPALGWQQKAAAAMIGAIAMMFSSPAIASATATPVQAAPAVVLHHGAPTQIGPTDADHAQKEANPGYLQHVVQPGEQLPALAERYLGDKYQWHTIAAATYGITQPDGRQLNPGDTRVYPGWTVRIPAPRSTTASVSPTSSVATTAETATPANTATPARATTATETLTYQTRKGDWLWHVAERFLGDPLRYPEIAKLNPQLAHKYGSTFPDHVEAGDIITLPADAHDRGPRAHATGTLRTPAPPADKPPTAPAPGARPGVPSAPASAPTPSATTMPSAPASPSATVTPTEAGQPAPTIPGAASGPPTGAAPTAASPSTARTPDQSADAARQHPDSGIDLADRGWVTTELAAAVTAAAALVWLHRRRRYRPRPPGPARRDDPDLAPLPRTVAALHRSRPIAPTEDEMDAPEPHIRDAAAVTIASLGSQSGTVLHLRDLPAVGVGLTGPGAAAAARGLLASVLSSGGPWTPHAEAAIITTADDMRQLLPDHDGVLPAMERLHVADTLDHALDELERQLLRRARIVNENGDLATALALDADQALPPAVFLGAVPTAGTATRLAAILTIGSRLALAGVVLGDWVTGPTWLVDTDGTVTIDGHSGPRLNVLDLTATRDILDTVGQAHPAEDERPAPTTTGPAVRRLVDVTTTQAATAQPAATPTDATSPVTTGPASPPPETSREQLALAARRRLKITVLGKPALHIIDGEQRSGVRVRRSDGVQILIHLAVEPDGVTSDQLMALLWPEVRPHHSRGRFHTTISELRHTLAEAVGADPITRTDDRYHLEPDLVEVDLWRLDATIDRAATAVEPGPHAAALHDAITQYTGTLADGHNWLWLAPYREAVRRHIIDAHVALAAAEPDPRAALNQIQDAIRLDPFNEDLYQQAMRLHARLGSPDGVRRTLRTLTEQLNELEVHVSPRTQQVATELIERLAIRERARHGAA